MIALGIVAVVAVAVVGVLILLWPPPDPFAMWTRRVESEERRDVSLAEKLRDRLRGDLNAEDDAVWGDNADQ